jgi:ribosomal protein S18 acetylase RimI-like enzyme
VAVPVRIRLATVTDVAAVADLAARSFVAAVEADNDPDDVRRYVADAFAPERIATALTSAGSWFLLAHDPLGADAAPVGYAQLLRSGHDLVVALHPIQLVRLYVAPERTGGGVGGMLLAASLDRAAQLGSDAVWLGVWEHNTRAQRFYRRWGFRRVGEQSFQLGDDVQSDHVMVRSLGP